MTAVVLGERRAQSKDLHVHVLRCARDDRQVQVPRCGRDDS